MVGIEQLPLNKVIQCPPIQEDYEHIGSLISAVKYVVDEHNPLCRYALLVQDLEMWIGLADDCLDLYP